MGHPSTDTAAPGRLVTADELLAMGKGRRELIQGRVVEMTPTGFQHGRLEVRISSALERFVADNDLGTIAGGDPGFLIESDPDTVRAPDVAFVAKDRVVETEKYFIGPPDLAVEVISPNDTYSEVADKVRMWLAHGVKQVWVVDPRHRTIEVHLPDRPTRTHSGDEAIGGGELLPGFSLPLREMFPSAGK